MKKMSLIIGLLILSIGLTVNAQERHQPGTGYDKGNGHYSRGDGDGNGKGKGNGNGNGHGYGYGHNGGKGGGVGAPLDGGLLLVLGGAGVAYYASRKKSKKLES